MLFIFTFFLFVYALHYYIFLRMWKLMGIKRSWKFHLLVPIVAYSYIYTTMFDRFNPSNFTHWLHQFAGIWLGIGLMLIVILFAFDAVKFVLWIFSKTFYQFRFKSHQKKRLRKAELAAVLIIATIVCCLGFYNARNLIIEKVEIPSSVDMKIVQLSDVHIGSRSLSFLKETVDQANALNPDIVVITGDLVDSLTIIDDRFVETLDQLDAPSYFITGNHENYVSKEKLFQLMQKSKVQWLDDKSVDIGKVKLIGVSDSHNGVHLESRLSQLEQKKGEYRVLLHHRPDALQVAQKYGIDLFLAGHTHAGQLFPFSYFVKLRYKYIKGLHKLGDMNLYISPGTGTWGPPMRLGSTGTITEIKLIKAVD